MLEPTFVQCRTPDSLIVMGKPPESLILIDNLAGRSAPEKGKNDEPVGREADIMTSCYASEPETDA